MSSSSSQCIIPTGYLRLTARQSVVVEEIRSVVARSRNDSGLMKFSDIAGIILITLREASGSGLTVGDLKARIRGALASFPDNPHIPIAVDTANMCSVLWLPDIIKQFCKVSIPKEVIHEIFNMRPDQLECSAAPLPLADRQFVEAYTKSEGIAHEVGLVLYDGATYQKLSNTALVDQLVLRDIEIDKLKRDKQQLHVQLHRGKTSTRPNDKAGEVIQQLVGQMNYRSSIFGHKISVSAGYSFAVRRNRIGVGVSQQALVN